MIFLAKPEFTATLGPFFRFELGPILQVACERLCGLALQPASPRPFGPMPGRVFVAVLADRPDGARSAGPRGFHGPSLTAVLRAAPYVAVVSSEPDLGAYQEAAAVVRSGHSAVLIETGPERDAAWRTYVECTAAGRLRSRADLPPAGRA